MHSSTKIMTLGLVFMAFTPQKLSARYNLFEAKEPRKVIQMNFKQKDGECITTELYNTGSIRKVRVLPGKFIHDQINHHKGKTSSTIWWEKNQIFNENREKETRLKRNEMNADSYKKVTRKWIVPFFNKKASKSMLDECSSGESSYSEEGSYSGELTIDFMN